MIRFRLSLIREDGNIRGVEASWKSKPTSEAVRNCLGAMLKRSYVAAPGDVHKYSKVEPQGFGKE